LVVRGKKPFKIVDVKCDDDCFSIAKSAEARAVHLVPVEFTANEKPGKVSREISLLTDQGEGDALVFTAYAQVVNEGVASEPKAAKEEEPAEQ
jgi:hypothetical protein